MEKRSSVTKEEFRESWLEHINVINRLGFILTSPQDQTRLIAVTGELKKLIDKASDLY